MPKLTAISTALLPNSAKLQIFPYYLSAFQFVSGINYNQLFDPETRLADIINNKIQVYDAQLGYPSGLTEEVVIEHLWDSTMVFHMLRDFRRRANAAELTDSHGINIGWAFSSEVKPKAGASGPTSYVMLPTINWNKEATEQYDITQVQRLSNTDWSALVGRAEGVVMMPKTWASIIAYYADNVFSLNSRDDDGHTQFIVFQTPPLDPYYNSSVGTNYAGIRSYLDKLDMRFKENPTLRLFLSTQMNIDRVINLFDFNRDMSARTVSIVEDTKILDALETTPNTFFDNLKYEDYLMERELIYTPGDVYMSPLNYDDFIEVDISSMLEKVLLVSPNDGDDSGGYVPPMLSSYILIDAYKKDSDYPIVFSLPPGTLVSDSQMPADLIENITFAMETFPLDVPFRPIYHIDSSDRIDRDLSNIGVKAGFNFYSLNEDDFLTVKLDMCLSLLFDGVPFKFSYPNPVLYDGNSFLVHPEKTISKGKDTKDKKESTSRKRQNNNKTNKDKK